MSSEARGSFFKQSGWMVITTFAGGVFMFGVHVFGPVLGDAEYGLFVTLLGIMNLMTIPSLGLQTTFAQQAAAAVTPKQNETLTAAVQNLLFVTFAIWLLIAAGVLIFQRQIMANLTINNPAALWMTVVIALGQLWTPILLGVLQGKQNFLWYGWSNIVNGIGRFAAIGLIVTLLGAKAAGAVTGAAVGIFGAVLIGFIQSRAVWLKPRPSFKFDWSEWLQTVVPLTIGLGASQVLFSLDLILVRSLFGEAGTGYYGGAGMIGRGLVIFTAPLALVMFPKVVSNVTQGKKSNVLLHTLGATFLLGGFAAVVCTIGAVLLTKVANGAVNFGFLPATLVAKLQENREGVTILGRLIPWFVWGMLPLALANVLLSNLLARRRFRVLLYVIAIVLAYVLALAGFTNSFLRAPQILTLFSVLYLAMLGLFTWLDHKATAKSESIQ